MRVETITAETGFSRFDNTLLPKFWSTQPESGLAFRYVNLDATANAVTLNEQLSATRTFATGLSLQEDAVLRPLSFPEAPSRTPSGCQLAFEMSGQPVRIVNASHVVPCTAWYNVLSGMVPEPQKLVFEYILQAPNATGSLVGLPLLEVERLDQNQNELEVLRENVEGDWVTPTPYAYERARSIVDVCSDAPVAFMTTDGEGGIRMVWRRGEKQVRANIGARPDLKSYIYYESPDIHDVERLQANNLLERLHWLNA